MLISVGNIVNFLKEIPALKNWLILKHLLIFLGKFHGIKLLILCFRIPNLGLNNCLFALKKFSNNENLKKYCILFVKNCQSFSRKLFILLENYNLCTVKLHDLLTNC